MRVAIVLLNWNGKGLLERFLPSVTACSGNAGIYVADNASSDGSVAFLQQDYPHIKIIPHSENKGFAQGYNEALQQVEAEVYCLLNTDVEVTPDWLEPVLEQFKRDDAVAVIQPRLLDHNRKDYFEYAGAAGGFLDRYGFPFCRGRIFDAVERDHGQYNDTTEIFWASGACFFIRSRVFHRLGGFDEDYFAHQEEIDLCWRVHHAGYKVLYTGTSTVYHVGGATLSHTRPGKTYLNFRNSLFSLVKNLPKGRVFSTLFIRLALDGVAGLRFLVRGEPRHCFAILKAHFHFYIRLGKMLKKRKAFTPTPHYYRTKSIVWAYFIVGKKYFHDL